MQIVLGVYNQINSIKLLSEELEKRKLNTERKLELIVPKKSKFYWRTLGDNMEYALSCSTWRRWELNCSYPNSCPSSQRQFIMGSECLPSWSALGWYKALRSKSRLSATGCYWCVVQMFAQELRLGHKHFQHLLNSPALIMRGGMIWD